MAIALGSADDSDPRLDELLAEALAALERGDHATIANILAANPGYALKIQEFLEQISAAQSFFAATPPHVDLAGLSATLHHQPQARAEGVGDVLGGKYKLLQSIGEGGMGAVFMAQQLGEVKRLVAVKLVRGDLTAEKFLVRFEAERQALALMDHPNIAKVFDAGATPSGRPFYVMELVKGRPLLRYCDERRLSVAERLSLFVQICHGVQHAHQKGLIHRDLKPSNILVAEHDDRPVPKIIDFGLAKPTSGVPLTEKTLVTDFGAVVGTYLYMAPEQAKFNALDIDTRADVYALGVILYELLTGATPIERKQLQDAALDEVLRCIREVEAPRPSERLSKSDSLPAVAASRKTEPAQLARSLRGDLDWIVMKALEKDRERRYATPAAIAEDLARYQALQPVLAGPPSALYRLCKAFRRHRTAIVATVAVSLALIISLVVGVVSLVTAANSRAQVATLRTEKVQADAAKSVAESQARATAILNDGLRYQRLLARIRERESAGLPGWTWENLADLRAAAAIPQLGAAAEIRSAAASAVTASDIRPAGELPLSFHGLRSLAFHPRRNWLAVGDGLAGNRVQPLRLAVVEVDSRKVVHELTVTPRFALSDLGRKDGLNALAFSPNGRWLVGGSGVGNLYVWDLDASPPQFQALETGLARIVELVFSLDGKSLVLREYDKDQPTAVRIACWQLQPWRERARLTLKQPPVSLLPLPGDRLLIAGEDSAAEYELQTLNLVAEPTPVAGLGELQRLDPTRRVLARIQPESLELYERATGELVRLLPADANRSTAGRWLDLVYFTPDAQLVLGISHERRLLLAWSLAEGRLTTALPLPLGKGNYALAVSADSRWIAIGSDERTLLFERRLSPQHRLQAPSPRPLFALGLSAAGDRLACGRRSATSTKAAPQSSPASNLAPRIRAQPSSPCVTARCGGFPSASPAP